ncbi:hypothetical protein C8A03DRAFT_35798 [Achaetomium macrosporum]|uniref:Ankyrin n=1 Tax=Achaetomium macrosporum TaxID=79813 RepID=A0AAN7C7E9_9PEZI|nr:hypothetical protein C8A03DRAFT_35798 [Achaetomium macrosporum]
MRSRQEVTEQPEEVAPGDQDTSVSESTPTLPGVLTLTLHEEEGVGMTAPDHYKHRRLSYAHAYNQPYALVEYEKCRVVIESFSGTAERPMWKGRRCTRKFDVSQFAVLIIFLYLRDLVAGRGEGPHDLFLGAARVDLLDALWKWESGSRWLDIQDGTGRIRISLQYRHVGTNRLDISSDFRCLFNSRYRKEDKQQIYFAKRVPASEAALAAYSRKISHPFISPLIFTLHAVDNGSLYLLAPSVNGGYLTIEEEAVRELVWEPNPGEFHIYNHITQTRGPIRPRHAADAVACRDLHATTDPTIPSQRQKHEALEAALQAGYDDIVSQLLANHDMDLNILISVGEPPKQTTPLKWATEQDNLSLAHLFLTKGADTNFPRANGALASHHGGPALIKAVERGNQALAALLVSSTNRVASARALGLTVDRQDAGMAALLLPAGVRCDFEIDDRPDPRHPDDIASYGFELSEPEEFLPPLVRAVRHCNVCIVRLLLVHGADANVGYHNLRILPRDDGEGHGILLPQAREDAAWFECGRVELTVALRRADIVRLLLSAGADIGRAQPVWNVAGHECC